MSENNAVTFVTSNFKSYTCAKGVINTGGFTKSGVAKVTRLQNGDSIKPPGGQAQHYRMKAETGRFGVTGAVRKRNVPMATGWRWYVLQIEPGNEFAAQRRLKHAGFEDTFLPLHHVEKRNTKRKQLLARPRIVGYLFIGFSSPGIPWPDVLAAKGVIDVVAFDGVPLALSAAEMHKLVLAAQRPRRVLGGAARVRSKKKDVHGSVQILSGPYAGCVVRVMNTDEGEALYAFDTRKYRLNAEPANYSVNGRKIG